MGIGSFYAVSDVDCWRFDAEIGDHITARIETENEGVYPRLYLRNSGDADLATVNGDFSSAQIQNYVITAPGAYYWRVWSDNLASRYRLRVD
jgi:hypothetical protein